MKRLAVLATIVLFAALFSSCSARSEPVCGHKNADGSLTFLKYWTYSQKGEEYVEFGSDGKCLKKVECLSDYTMKIDECSDVKISCDNKNLYGDGVFPKCCIKC